MPSLINARFLHHHFNATLVTEISRSCCLDGVGFSSTSSYSLFASKNRPGRRCMVALHQPQHTDSPWGHRPSQAHRSFMTPSRTSIWRLRPDSNRCAAALCNRWLPRECTHGPHWRTHLDCLILWSTLLESAEAICSQMLVSLLADYDSRLPTRHEGQDLPTKCFETGQRHNRVVWEKWDSLTLL